MSRSDDLKRRLDRLDDEIRGVRTKYHAATSRYQALSGDALIGARRQILDIEGRLNSLVAERARVSADHDKAKWDEIRRR